MLGRGKFFCYIFLSPSLRQVLTNYKYWIPQKIEGDEYCYKSSTVNINVFLDSCGSITLPSPLIYGVGLCHQKVELENNGSMK